MNLSVESKCSVMKKDREVMKGSVKKNTTVKHKVVVQDNKNGKMRQLWRYSYTHQVRRYEKEREKVQVVYRVKGVITESRQQWYETNTLHTTSNVPRNKE